MQSSKGLHNQVVKIVVPYCRANTTHWTENRIYVFPEKELRSLSPNSYIHVSVSDLYIPRIGPHIWLQQNIQTEPGNI
jgi:hypothetical protein